MVVAKFASTTPRGDIEIMIINLCSPGMTLVFPEGYEQLRPKNPFERVMVGGEPAEAYQKLTPDASCVVACFKTTKEKAMDPDCLKEMIGGIHSVLTDTQGLIEVKAGTAARGWKYIYSIIRDVSEEAASTGRVVYTLRLNIFTEERILELLGSFEEIGDSGLRDSIGRNMAEAAGLLKMGAEDDGWRSDPYDPLYKKGIPMNLAERAGLDGLFSHHPLSQAREFAHAVIYDELMLPPAEKDSEKTELKNMASEAEKQAFLKKLFSPETERRYVPQKVDVNASKEKKPFWFFGKK